MPVPVTSAADNGGAAETRPITALRGAGPAVARRLEELGVTRIGDLLLHLPTRYEDRSRVAPLGGLRPGMHCLVRGRIDHAEVAVRRRRSLLVHLSDGTGSLLLRFFTFSPRLRALLKPGLEGLCFGEVRTGSGPWLEMVHPDCEWGVRAAAVPDGRLTAVYPLTRGLQQGTVRRLLQTALDEYLPRCPELLPEALLTELGLPGFRTSVALLHRPPAADDPAVAQQRRQARDRLAFEELLAHHLVLQARRRQRERRRAPALAAPCELQDALRKALPFHLTAAQERVVAEIGRDLERTRPMLRLLQGDVGSGKTLVAALALLHAVEAGHQGALMAPTDLLAEQHCTTLAAWLPALGVPVVRLTGQCSAAERRTALQMLAHEPRAVAVGTHALFQQEVGFARLGLVVIDEQHRFGVQQRLALRDKGAHGARVPHQLVMTATPIPRTLAMHLYADLDSSVIDERPPGRQPVETVALPDSRRDEVIARIAEACAAGRQVYWVCPLVEESEHLPLRTATGTAEELAAALPRQQVGLVHGRMKGAEKDAVMRAFSAHELDLIVATTVIEVGVDVPNASLMVIDHAERLGLAQLHQLRGRVGRGQVASSCVLLYARPLSQMARRRLAAMRETDDGFRIAELDLELRGPGELLGARQSGALALRIADLETDGALVARVAQAAAHPALDTATQRGLEQRWIAAGGRYADA